MPRPLDPAKLDALRLEAGLSMTALAGKVGVSPQAVSNWSSGESQPRPRALLSLALTLGVSQNALLAGPVEPAPRVSFRIKANRKIKPEYRESINRSARYLGRLVPYLPEQMCRPAVVRNPQLDYGHVQREATRFRAELGLGVDSMEMDLSAVIGFVRDSGAIIVPVPWGARRHPVNGVHVFLSDPASDWLFINVDTPVVDAKFWLLHEIAHMLTPSMDPESDESEEYAEAFAGAVLLPSDVAGRLHSRLLALKGDRERIVHLKKLATALVVSPLTLYLESRKYAASVGEPPVDLGKSIYGAMTNVVKETPTLSEILFRNPEPGGREFVESCSRAFGAVFFGAIGRLIREQDKSSGLVARLLDVPPADAMEIWEALRDYGTAEDPA